MVYDKKSHAIYNHFITLLKGVLFMNSKTPGTGSRSYTKTSLILDFLHGSIHFFVISILSAMVVTGLDMVSTQLIRTTVDSVL